MEQFNEKELLNAKNLEWIGKYKEKNPISKILINNFYHDIKLVIQHYLDLDCRDGVLEVGCGAGISSLRIRNMLPHGQHFEVSDIDENVIRTFMETNFPIPFQMESVTNLNRENGEFSCVFLLEVLEHIPDYQTALSEIFRVSNKYVVVSTPNEPLWRILNLTRGKYISNLGNTPGHINHWSRSSLVSLISNYGKIMKVFTPIPWTIVVAKKYS